MTGRFVAKMDAGTRLRVARVPHARAPRDERYGRGAGGSPAKARRVSAELAMLRAKIDRLHTALRLEQARVTELEARADTDPLTGVFNRRGFERELKRSLSYVGRYGTCAALLYLDLDGFKPVNDRYGHAAGDAVLTAVAATLTRSVRASDTVARLGGDEFGLILWNLAKADALKKARALEAAIGATSVEWTGVPLSAAASIGVAILDPSADPAAMMAAADQAMYARKAARRGTILPPNR